MQPGRLHQPEHRGSGGGGAGSGRTRPAGSRPAGSASAAPAARGAGDASAAAGGGAGGGGAATGGPWASGGRLGQRDPPDQRGIPADRLLEQAAPAREGARPVLPRPALAGEHQQVAGPGERHVEEPARLGRRRPAGPPRAPPRARGSGRSSADAASNQSAQSRPLESRRARRGVAPGRRAQVGEEDHRPLQPLGRRGWRAASPRRRRRGRPPARAAAGPRASAAAPPARRRCRRAPRRSGPARAPSPGCAAAARRRGRPPAPRRGPARPRRAAAGPRARSRSRSGRSARQMARNRSSRRRSSTPMASPSSWPSAAAWQRGQREPGQQQQRRVGDGAERRAEQRRPGQLVAGIGEAGQQLAEVAHLRAPGGRRRAPAGPGRRRRAAPARRRRARWCGGRGWPRRRSGAGAAAPADRSARSMTGTPACPETSARIRAASASASRSRRSALVPAPPVVEQLGGRRQAPPGAGPPAGRPAGRRSRTAAAPPRPGAGARGARPG